MEENISIEYLVKYLNIVLRRILENYLWSIYRILVEYLSNILRNFYRETTIFFFWKLTF